MTKRKIGWIGLGNMGLPMATNLLKSGFEVTVYNRTKSKAEPLFAMGAKWADTAKQVAEQVDTVITMVSDSATVEAVMFGENGVAEGLRPGQTVIDMSTIAPAMTRSIAARLKERDVLLLDAPVSGSVKPATEGTLVILVGGERAVYEQHLPIFDVLGKKSFYFGLNGQGANAKLVVNLMLGVFIEGFSEALVLAEKTGLDRQTILEMIAQTAVNAPIVSGKMPSILANNYEAAFALKHAEKDLGLALEMAKQAAVALPATSAAHQAYVAAKANGLAEQDLMAVLLQLEHMGGLK